MTYCSLPRGKEVIKSGEKPGIVCVWGGILLFNNVSGGALF